jgi:hypothetical protein
MKYFHFIILLMAVILSAGCVSENKNGAFTPTASTPVPTPTTAILTMVITPEITTSEISTITPNETITTSSEPPKTPTPKPDPTDISEIKFLRYSDNDFSVDYPSTWIISNSTYFPYYCESVLDTSRNDYHVCFENETKSIGPFYFWENDHYKKPYRIVTFTSADGKLKFVSYTQDFLETMSGNYMLKPNMDWTRAQFEARYPNLTALTYITNYKYYQSQNVLVSTFDVKLPEGSNYYPSAYTEKAMVTLHHVGYFAFITDNENFDKYRNLKDRIISSIVTNDKS